jgi:hypothetical protein
MKLFASDGIRCRHYTGTVRTGQARAYCIGLHRNRPSNQGNSTLLHETARIIAVIVDPAGTLGSSITDQSG